MVTSFTFLNSNPVCCALWLLLVALFSSSCSDGRGTNRGHAEGNIHDDGDDNEDNEYHFSDNLNPKP